MGNLFIAILCTQLRCKVFENALEIRAAQLPGLDGKSSLLTELARLRGEAIATAKTIAAKDGALKRTGADLADAKARNSVLSEQLMVNGNATVLCLI